MKPSLIDTDILSMFFRGNRQVIARFDEYLQQGAKINLSIVTYYEIISPRRAKKILPSLKK